MDGRQHGVLAKSRTLANRRGTRAHLIPCVKLILNSYSVKRKVNPTRLIELRGGCVTESHSRTGYTCHFSKKPPGLSPVRSFALCIYSILFSLSIPLSGYSIYTSSNVHLPMAIMALQASYYIMNRHFPLLSGNVFPYSLSHIPKKEK